jgi:hypothetical protein
VKKSNSKTATIVATYRDDLSLVLNWLRLLKVIKGVGDIVETKSGAYRVTVRSKLSKSDLNDRVKDRFGSFAKVL